MFKLLFPLTVILLSSLNAFSHPGGLDSEKCHYDKNMGLRHCHTSHGSIPDNNPELLRKYNQIQAKITKMLNSAQGESVETIYSSWIERVTYFNNKNILIIEPLKTSPIIFANFEKNMWEMFKKAPSKGSYYHRYLKGQEKYNFEDF